MIGQYLTEKEVHIGHRQRPASTVTKRARIGTGTPRADTQLDAIEPADRTAARSHRLDGHHRCDNANAGLLGFILQLEAPVETRHVGTCASHVESDRLYKARGAGNTREANNATGRAGQDAVLTREPFSQVQTACRC